MILPVGAKLIHSKRNVSALSSEISEKQRLTGQYEIFWTEKIIWPPMSGFRLAHSRFALESRLHYSELARQQRANSSHS
jgi:hypothetical protein